MSACFKIVLSKPHKRRKPRANFQTLLMSPPLTPLEKKFRTSKSQSVRCIYCQTERQTIQVRSLEA